MKKKNIIVSIIILVILFIKIDVNAATNTSCSTNDLSIYRLEANNVSVTYEVDNDSEGRDPDPKYYYMTLVIGNVTQNISIKVGNFIIDYNDTENGEIKFYKMFYQGGHDVKIQVITSSSTACPNTQLKTINYHIPYWNRFSGREECKNHEELAICRMNTNADDIEDDEFEKIFNSQKKAYEESLKKEKKGFNLFNWYWKNKKITVPITVGIIGIALVICIVMFIKNRKKVKIDLGKEI